MTPMSESVKRLMCDISWRFPGSRWFSSRNPFVLFYHGVARKGTGQEVDAEAFERHIVFLKRHFEVVPPDEVHKRRSPFSKKRVIITFDDGFRNNAEVAAPILRKYEVPAIFFVSSRHVKAGKYLWVDYLGALARFFPGEGFQFAGRSWDMSEAQRVETMVRLTSMLLDMKSHPLEMYRAIEEELPRLEEFLGEHELRDRLWGMTPEQVRDLGRDPLFKIGCHTLDHPYLTRCEPAECMRQLKENKQWIEGVTGRRCDTVSYPLNDYDRRVIGFCRELGFNTGYAVRPRIKAFPEFEVRRIGVYSPDLSFLGLKANWSNVLLRLTSLESFESLLDRIRDAALVGSKEIGKQVRGNQSRQADRAG